MVTARARRAGLLAFAFALVFAAPAMANDTPVCNSASYTVPGDTDLPLQANCSDGDGPLALTYSLVTGVSFGSLVGTPSGDSTYRSVTGYVGADSFTYRAFDGQDYSEPATVSITVTAKPAPVGDRAPICPDPLNFVPQGGYLDLVGHCVDPDDDPVTYQLTSFPTGGALSITGANSVRYTPNAGTVSDHFGYSASDPQGATTLRTVNIQVVPAGTQDFASAAEATESDPYVVGLHTDGSGPVTIAERFVSSPPPSGFYFLTQEFDITAPPGSLQDPLRLTFTVDRLSAPAGTIEVFRDGSQVPDPCPTVLVEGSLPCVQSTTTLDPSGDIQVTVLSDHASRWNLAVPAVMPFSGFFAPLNPAPTLNSMNAGRAVPVKFALAGDRGLAIIAPGYPRSQRIDCGNAAVDGVEETSAAGASALTYDALRDQYSYVWKTDPAWAGSCRQLVVKLIDGTRHRASFRFR